MKKIVFTILALVVLSLALSAQVVFKESKDSRHPDVSGHIYIYSNSQHAWVVDTNHTHSIDIRLYIDATYSEERHDIEWTNNGYYSHNYIPNIDYSFCHYVEVECEGVVDSAEYIDGMNNIVDIYLGYGPYPTPDNTIPAEY